MRPILLGMCDPSGTEPLGIDDVPRSAAGHRLWKLSGLSRDQWLAAFDRRNLVPGKTWLRFEARRLAIDFVRSMPRGRRVVCLGREVAEAVARAGGRPPDFSFIPHPSGRCLAYNDAAVRKQVVDLLRSLARGQDGT